MFHMASILYIDRLFPDRAKTFGQAVNNAVTYGLGLTLGFIISGWIYEAYGSAHIFIFSCVTALLGGVILWYYYKKSAATS